MLTPRGPEAALIMVIILALLFNVRWRLLPFFVVAVGLVWAFGLAGYIGIPLTLASIAGLPVLLGIGIDYAIRLHSHVEEEVVLDRAAPPHPGHGPQPWAGPAGRDLRRRLRLPSPSPLPRSR